MATTTNRNPGNEEVVVDTGKVSGALASSRVFSDDEHHESGTCFIDL